MSEPKAAKILVLEDEAVIRGLLSDMLRQKGYEVLESGNGEDAIGRLEDAHGDGQPFDLAILDLTLPGEMDGLDVLHKSRKLTPGIKAIIASGYADEEMQADVGLEGQVELLNKPYNIVELLALVQNLLK